MFIELTNKGSKVFINVDDIIIVGEDSKKGTFMVTSSMDILYPEDGYESIKARLDELSYDKELKS